jgi:hypothetical protein
MTFLVVAVTSVVKSAIRLPESRTAIQAAGSGYFSP